MLLMCCLLLLSMMSLTLAESSEVLFFEELRESSCCLKSSERTAMSFLIWRIWVWKSYWFSLEISSFKWVKSCLMLLSSSLRGLKCVWIAELSCVWISFLSVGRMELMISFLMSSLVWVWGLRRLDALTKKVKRVKRKFYVWVFCWWIRWWKWCQHCW